MADTTRREAQIDTEIAAAYTKVADAEVTVERADVAVHRNAGDKRSWTEPRTWGMTYAAALKAADEATTTDAAMAHRDLGYARDDLATAEAKYEGWSRFFLVTNAGGHIHSSMHCSSCFVTTAFAWLPTLSGLTETDAVAEQGERLCSVCFPDAPVAWRDGYFVSQKAAAKAERDAAKQAKADAKAAKAAKRAETYHYVARFTRSDGEVFGMDERTRRVTTLKGATKEAREMGGLDGYNGKYEVVDLNTGEVVS